MRVIHSSCLGDCGYWRRVRGREWVSASAYPTLCSDWLVAEWSNFRKGVTAPATQEEEAEYQTGASDSSERGTKQSDVIDAVKVRSFRLFVPDWRLDPLLSSGARSKRDVPGIEY